MKTDGLKPFIVVCSHCARTKTLDQQEVLISVGFIVFFFPVSERDPILNFMFTSQYP
jgi:hypothetical protein